MTISIQVKKLCESDIIEFLQIPHVKKAVIQAPCISEAQYRRILSGLTSNQVHELSLFIGQRGFNCAHELTRFSSLTRLDINFSSHGDDCGGVSENEVQSLHLIPNLTELSISDLEGPVKSGQRSCTYAIEKCTKLINLQIFRPRQVTDQVNRGFASTLCHWISSSRFAFSESRLVFGIASS